MGIPSSIYVWRQRQTKSIIPIDFSKSKPKVLHKN
jgi:hypothetical protein